VRGKAKRRRRRTSLRGGGRFSSRGGRGGKKRIGLISEKGGGNNSRYYPNKKEKRKKKKGFSLLEKQRKKKRRLLPRGSRVTERGGKWFLSFSLCHAILDQRGKGGEGRVVPSILQSETASGSKNLSLPLIFLGGGTKNASSFFLREGGKTFSPQWPGGLLRTLRNAESFLFSGQGEKL